MEVRRPRGLSLILPLASCLTLGHAGALRGQASEQRQAAEAFDTDRALLMDTTRFRPFNVSTTQPLRAVLDEELVQEDTPLLVMEHSTGTLGLLVEQMAYHHVAQGKLAGEPWMVSF